MSIPSRWNPSFENEILEFWNKNHIYEKWKLKNNGKRLFVYLDGPPYTTGKIHLGHAWGKAIRDAIMRFKRKTGYFVWDRPGFDMHGLPIEVKIEKKLNIKSKEDIYKVGPEKFVEEAREFSIENMEKMIDDFKRLGVFMDWDLPYMTISNEYIESIWYLFKRAYEKGILYEDYKVCHWCPRCQTVLAKHEIDLARYEAWYKPLEEDSIYVKFKTKDGRYLVIWTTTPWTLPFNLGVMVNPEEEYCDVKVGKDIWILAKKRVEPLMKKFNIQDYKILKEYRGSKLELLEYIPIFYEELKDFYEDLKKKSPNVFKVWLSKEYVTVEDGTGLVHAAPGCGPEDQEVAKRYNVPPFSLINEKGEFIAPDIFKGLKAKEDDKIFIQKVKEKGALVFIEKIQHDYPFCWRCASPVIFRPVKQYFLNVQKIKEGVIEDLKNTYWVDNLGKDAIINGVSSAPDWVVTRQRFWGTPIPIWICEKGHKIIISSKEELEKLTGNKFRNIYIIECKTDFAKDLIKWYIKKYNILEDVTEDKIKELINNIDNLEKDTAIFIKGELSGDFIQELKNLKGIYVLRHKGHSYNLTRIYNYDLHKGYLDNLKIKCPECGSSAKIIGDVLDVWIDSGCASWAVFEYPKKETFKETDFIIEGKDQIRGWFYSLAILGKITVDKVPYKAVYVTGFVKDSKGLKMSKSLGNVVTPEEMISKYGADALRLYLITAVTPFRDINFNEKDVKTKFENLNVLWNIHKYLINYAKYYNINPSKLKLKYENLDIEEKWMLSRLYSTLKVIKEDLEKYKTYKAAKFLEDLWLDLSRIYIKLTRKKLNEGSAKEKEKVLWTIYNSLFEILKVSSIFVPFISEKIYQNLKKEFNLSEESIMYYEYPSIKEEYINKELEADMDIFLELLETGQRLREKIKVSLRWPLKGLYIKEKVQGIYNSLSNFERLIKENLNIKEIYYEELPLHEEIDDNSKFFTIAYNTEQDESLLKEGLLREIIRRLQNIRKEMGLWKEDKIELSIEGDLYLLNIIKENIDKIKETVNAEIYFDKKILSNKDIKMEKDFKIKGYHLKVYIFN